MNHLNRAINALDAAVQHGADLACGLILRAYSLLAWLLHLPSQGS
jgi:hypothetical protein